MTINIKKILNINISKYIDLMIYLADETKDNDDWPWDGGRSRLLSTDQLHELIDHKDLSLKRKIKIFNASSNMYHDKKESAKDKFGRVQNDLIREVEEKRQSKELKFNVLISIDRGWPIKSDENPLVIGEIFAKIEFLQYLKNLDNESNKKEFVKDEYLNVPEQIQLLYELDFFTTEKWIEIRDRGRYRDKLIALLLKAKPRNIRNYLPVEDFIKSESSIEARKKLKKKIGKEI